MTEYVCLTPPGVSVSVRVADVDVPQVVPVSELAGWARREALRRELAELDAQLGTPQVDEARHASRVEPMQDPYRIPHPSLQPVDDGEVHRAFKRPGPQHMCRCHLGFDSRDELVAHQRRCGVALRHRSLDGHAEPGGYQWGEA